MDKRVGRRIEISLIGVAGQDSWTSALDPRFWSACPRILRSASGVKYACSMYCQCCMDLIAWSFVEVGAAFISMERRVRVASMNHLQAPEHDFVQKNWTRSFQGDDLL